MRQGPKNIISGKEALARRLAGEKKKVVVAVVLIALMVVMWARLLTKGDLSANANAALLESASGSSADEESTKVTFVELPEIAGRHDVLQTDFFAAAGWRIFKKGEEAENSGNVEEVNVFVEKDGGDVSILEVAGTLRLDAISSGERPQAFLGGKLISVNESFSVRYRQATYEFEVITIEQDSVVLKCDGVTVTIKMPQANQAGG